ncbi:hypothetical protein OXX80_003799 [Metschnikowia pulcherrima]
MCGRYALGTSIENLPEQFNKTVLNPGLDTTLQDAEDSRESSMHYETTSSVEGNSYTIELNVSSPNFDASYNIPPTGTGVIVYMDKQSSSDKKSDYSYHIEASKFGLLPVWAKPQDSSRVKKGSGPGAEYSREVQQHQAKLFNCRKETLAQARTVWAEPRKHTRCVVPISGYFEWLDSKQGKIPHFIYSPDHPLLFLAGLYSHNTNYNETEIVPKGEQYFSSFSIVTGPAKGEGKNDMSWLHSRKPIFIEPNSKAWYEWLSPDDCWDEKKLETCLNTETNPVYESFQWHTVAKSVGNPTNKGPEVIEEEKEKQQLIASFFQKKEPKDRDQKKGIKKESNKEKASKDDVTESETVDNHTKSSSSKRSRKSHDEGASGKRKFKRE